MQGNSFPQSRNSGSTDRAQTRREIDVSKTIYEYIILLLFSKMKYKLAQLQNSTHKYPTVKMANCETMFASR